MAERRSRSQHAGVADQHVELAIAFVQRRSKPRQAFEVGEIERHQRRAAAVFLDRIVQLLKAADGARDRHNVRAVTRQRFRNGAADAARGASDKSNAGGEEFWHNRPKSSSCEERCHSRPKDGVASLAYAAGLEG